MRLGLRFLGRGRWDRKLRASFVASADAGVLDSDFKVLSLRCIGLAEQSTSSGLWLGRSLEAVGLPDFRMCRGCSRTRFDSLPLQPYQSIWAIRKGL